MTYSGIPAQCWHASEMAAHPHGSQQLHGSVAGMTAAGFPVGAPLINHAAMTYSIPAYQVAAFYQFAALPDFRELREPLRALCAGT